MSKAFTRETDQDDEDAGDNLASRLHVPAARTTSPAAGTSACVPNCFT
jgi:hypothetical protein